MKRKYDSTVARMAGNIAGGMVNMDLIGTVPAEAAAKYVEAIAMVSVDIARAIVTQVIRTEPDDEAIEALARVKLPGDMK